MTRILVHELISKAIKLNKKSSARCVAGTNMAQPDHPSSPSNASLTDPGDLDSQSLHEYVSTQITSEAILAQYRPQDAEDETVAILQNCFKFFPFENRNILAKAISSHSSSNETIQSGLHELASTLLTAVLIPLRNPRGPKTPITPSTDPAITLASAQIVTLASGDYCSNLQTLRDQTLQRDGYRCVLSGLYDTEQTPGLDYSTMPHGPLEMAHIIPRALAFKCRDTPADNERKSRSWAVIHQFFPQLEELGMTPTTVDSVNNTMTLADTLHTTFDNFSWVLESTDRPYHYRVKRWKFPTAYEQYLPRDGIIELAAQHNPQLQLPAPEPFFLQVREAVAKVLHAIGRAEDIIQPVSDDFEEASGQALATDGSTNIEGILWSGKLALLPAGRYISRSDTTEEQTEQKSRVKTKPTLPESENVRPSAQ